MDKLTGPDYINHWRNRMKRSPLEAGTEQNADEVWAFIHPFVKDLKPETILEYGCAYGRMLRRLHREWPGARLLGVDLSKEALDYQRTHWEFGEPPTTFNQSTPPLNVRVDLVFTCTVLQHITDDAVLRKVAEGLEAIINPGGHLILFENITYAKGGGGRHMRHFGPWDYMDLWPELEWKDCGTFMHGKEAHEVMIGEKK